MSKSTTHSMEQREQAVAAYVSEGTLAGASRITGILADTIGSWRRGNPSWWQETENRIREQFEDKRRAKLERIIVSGLDQIEDRVVNGEYMADDDGGFTKRKPMAARDLILGTGLMIDKLRTSLGQATSIAGKSDSTVAEKLNALRTAARNAAKEQAKEEGKLVEMGRDGSPDLAPKTLESEIAA
jgi:hypothetical protein